MNYPFTAIVGQEKLKKALLLCAINPGIGGLLIQGDKGTAKSTAARALAEVVPMIIKAADCQFNCAEERPLDICLSCQDAERTMLQVQVPFINLPIGATEERVIGSIDLEGILAEKKKKFQPGLLAAVHQGILYIDEVNLLPDHLVDVLLDVAAMGENIIEREGFSLSHPSRFTLIGTMNPEEGQLRPQFLDRFGLMVTVDAPDEVVERTAVVRRRIAFENAAQSFVRQWQPDQENLQQQLLKAKELLPGVQLKDELLTLISEMTTQHGVKSLRADIVMYKTAITLAALDQRTEVTAEDIREAAELALAHRSRRSPAQPTASTPKSSPDTPTADKPSENSSANASENAEGKDGIQPPADNNEGESDEQVFNASQGIILPPIPGLNSKSEQEGKRNPARETNRGTYIRPLPLQNGSAIALDATVLQALRRNADELEITMADLQQKQRKGKVNNLILFVVDASGSMAASKRMEAVKGTVMQLLTDAYQKRDTVGVIAFRGISAQVLLEPTQSIDLAEEVMRILPTGGRTPLPHALQMAMKVAEQFRKHYHPMLIILTDGKANVALDGEGDPWMQTLDLASRLKNNQIQSVIINTESNYINLNKAEELAGNMGAKYISLQDISEDNLLPIVGQLL